VLGEGAMGEVWLATNTALDVPVAIKLLRGGEGAPPSGHVGRAFREQLLREAQATARVDASKRSFESSISVSPISETHSSSWSTSR